MIELFELIFSSGYTFFGTLILLLGGFWLPLLLLVQIGFGGKSRPPAIQGMELKNRPRRADRERTES